MQGLIIVAGGLSISFGSGLAQEPELLWEVGAQVGQPHEAWERIQDAIVIGDRVLVLDISASTTRAFSLTGDYLGDIGRRGEGPGEFLRPTAATRAGDSILVSDFAQRRVVVFDASLAIIGTSRELYPDVSGLEYVQPMEGGFVFGTLGPVWRMEDQRMLAHAVLWSEAELDTLSSFATNHVRLILRGDESRRHSIWLTTGPGEDWWPVNGQYVVDLETEGTLRILRIGASGLEEVERISLPGQSRPVTREEKEEWTETTHPDIDPRSRRYEFPESWPPWARVRGSDPNDLWVLRGGMSVLEPKLEPETWVQFDSAGRERQRVVMPPGVSVLRFDGSHILAVREDELDVQYFQVYRIGE